MSKKIAYIFILIMCLILCTSTVFASVGPAGALVESVIDLLRERGIFESPNFMLIVDILGEGTVNVNGEPYEDSYIYERGTVVELKAIPEPKWTFARWEDGYGAELGTETVLLVTMTRNTTVKAVFVEKEYILTVNVEGSGSVAKTPNQTKYKCDTQVTLTATSNPEWTFVRWEDEEEVQLGTDAVLVVGMTRDTTINAVFSETVANVKNYEELVGAIGNKIITTINIQDDITLEDTLNINKTITINGDENTVTGNIIVNANSVVLNDLHITGTLTVSDGVENFTANDCMLNGVVIEGGGYNSVRLTNVTVIGQFTVNSPTAVRIVFEDSELQGTITVNADNIVVFEADDGTIFEGIIDVESGTLQLEGIIEAAGGYLGNVQVGEGAVLNSLQDTLRSLADDLSQAFSDADRTTVNQLIAEEFRFFTKGQTPEEDSEMTADFFLSMGEALGGTVLLKLDSSTIVVERNHDNKWVLHGIGSIELFYSEGLVNHERIERYMMTFDFEKDDGWKVALITLNRIPPDATNPPDMQLEILITLEGPYTQGDPLYFYEGYTNTGGAGYYKSEYDITKPDGSLSGSRGGYISPRGIDKYPHIDGFPLIVGSYSLQYRLFYSLDEITYVLADEITINFEVE